MITQTENYDIAVVGAGIVGLGTAWAAQRLGLRTLLLERIDPFDNSRIDELILRELQKVYELPTWDINARWTGMYAKCIAGPWLQTDPEPNVTILNGFGGAGMSLSLAVTERVIRRKFEPSVCGSTGVVSNG